MDAPIFIVGAPRSGTTLLASMLAGHSRIACGPETQFFNKCSPKRLQWAVRDPQWPKRATELVVTLTLADQSVHELFGHTAADIHSFLTTRLPSEQAILESLTYLYAKKRNKVRWAEKTPNHLLHLPTLRRLYPHSPIIRIMRDPRDSALSMQQLPWASRSVSANGYLWTAWFRASQPFFETDTRTLTVLYEDLVADPQAVLRQLCDFIGETFEPAMLETQRHGSAVASPNETWKASNSQKLNTGRAQAWQRELDVTQQTLLGFCCLEGIEAFGYPVPKRPNRDLNGFPMTRRSIEAHERKLQELATQGIHVRASAHPLHHSDLIVLPNLTGSRKRQLKTLVDIGTVLFVRRLRGLSTTYLKPQGDRGILQSLMNGFTRSLARPYTVTRTPKSVMRQPLRLPTTAQAALSKNPRLSTRRYLHPSISTRAPRAEQKKQT